MVIRGYIVKYRPASAHETLAHKQEGNPQLTGSSRSLSLAQGCHLPFSDTIVEIFERKQQKVKYS